MKQKVLKNVWLRVAMLVAVVTTAFAGTAQAADELYKTALFGPSYNQGYDYLTNFNATNGDFTVTVTNFKSKGKKEDWNYIQTGGGKHTGTTATITTAAIDKAVTKVQLTIDAVGGTAPTITLQSTADYATWTNEGTFTASAGTPTVSIATPAENRYYRIEVVTPTSGSSNYTNISKIEYFVAAPDPDAPATPVISATNEPTFEASTVVTITVDDDATIMYSKTNGTHWETYTGDITLTETTTIKAKAVKGTKESPIVSKSFILASDVSTATWNLAATSTGVHTTNLLTWTNEAAAVLSFAKGAGENLPTAPKKGAHSFQTSNMVTIAPAEGYAIVSVDFVVSSGASALRGTWSNATVSPNGGNTITVTAIDGTKAISTTLTGACQIKTVNLNWSYSTSPYIAAADVTVPSTGEEGTITVDYNRISETPVLHVCDADGNDATYDWFTASLDADNNVSYSIAANEGSVRAAYLIISAGNVESEIITVTQEGDAPVETVTIGNVGYTTYVTNSAVSFPSEVTAFIVTAATSTMVTMEEVTSVPAGTAVVVKGAAGTYELTFVTSADAVAGNLLKASDGTVTGGTGIYALANKTNGVGFYPVAASVTIPAGKAYLQIAPAEAKAFYALEDDPTAIEMVNGQSSMVNEIYNLAGQRLQKMQKGINIINGKKILK